MSITREELLGLWKQIVDAITTKNYQLISRLTQNLYQAINSYRGYNLDNLLGKKIFLSDDEIGGFEPKIDRNQLLIWMHNSVIMREGSSLFFIGKMIKFDFDKYISTFKLVAELKDGLEKDTSLIEEFLKMQINALVAIKSSNPRPDIEIVEPILVKLQWCLKQRDISLEYMKTMLEQHKITELTLWNIGFDPTMVNDLINRLKLLGVLAPCEELKNIDDAAQKAQNLSMEQLFIELANNPGRMLSKLASNAASVDDTEHEEKANCIHRSCTSLYECHCKARFTRGLHNQRDESESRLIEILNSKYQARIPRIAIIGSGGLYQTLVVIAKIFQRTSIKEICLDLLDPAYFSRPSDCCHWLKQFVDLLSQLGFKLTLSANAVALNNYGKLETTFSPASKIINPYATLGSINLEIYANSQYSTYEPLIPTIYKQPADILFMIDCQISESELKANLEAAPTGAYLIAVLHSDQLKYFREDKDEFQVKEKQANGTWKPVAGVNARHKPYMSYS